MVFCASVKHAEQIVELFRVAGGIGRYEEYGTQGVSGQVRETAN